MIKKGIIIIFLMLLISPLAGWVSGIKVELDENRRLSVMPVLSIKGIYDQSFFSGFDIYFNDHFAYRRWLIKIKSWIDYYAFRTSPSIRVHLGTDGWLYYHRTIHGYFKVDDCIDSERKRMERIARQLHLLEKIVEASGRRFLFVVPPNKSTIYPEYFGVKRPISGCSKSHFDLLVYYFQKYPVKNFIRLDGELIISKGRHQLYYKTDTHWNYYGSMLASEAVLRHIAPETWMRYLPKINGGTEMYRGDLSKMLALNISEDAFYIKDVVYPYSVIERNLGRFNQGERLYFISESSSVGRLLPRTILFRDSFSSRMLPYLKGSFERLDVIWSNSVLTKLTHEPLQEVKESKIVILEIAEMYLPGLNIDLNAWYSAFLNKR